MNIFPILAPAITSLARSLLGWWENASEDGKFSPYEWGQLGATVIRVVVIYSGLSVGLQLEPLAASVGTIVVDLIVSKLKKK